MWYLAIVNSTSLVLSQQRGKNSALTRGSTKMTWTRRKRSVCSRLLCPVRQGLRGLWAVSALLWKSQTIKKQKCLSWLMIVNISPISRRSKTLFWQSASALKTSYNLWECQSLEVTQKFTSQISLELSSHFLEASSSVTSRYEQFSFRTQSEMKWASKELIYR